MEAFFWVHEISGRHFGYVKIPLHFFFFSFFSVHISVNVRVKSMIGWLNFQIDVCNLGLRSPLTRSHVFLRRALQAREIHGKP